MARLSDLLGRVHDEYPAVPKLVALRALSDAAKEFCVRSHAWQSPIGSLRVRPGRTTFDLSVDTGTMVASIKSVRLNGRKIDAYPAETLQLIRDTLAEALTPGGYVQRSPASIDIINPVTDVSTLSVTAALTLALDATDAEMPDDLLSEFGEAFANGAKGRLVKQANQPWFAPDAALVYLGPFYTEMNRAKRRANNALDGADMRVEMRPWV